MELKNLIYSGCNLTGVSGFFSAYGSFGVVDGIDADMEKISSNENGISGNFAKFDTKCVYTDYENGVVHRKDTFTAKEDIVLNSYRSRLFLEDGDYEVYTQFSCWQTESRGGWQKLVTGIEISNTGIRTTESATPMVALKNKGNGKILVIHLLPNANWKITVKRLPLVNKYTGILVETGINEKGLNMRVEAGETIEMPELYLYEAKSEIDLDAWKIHTVFNRLYPRKQLPVLYNTWLNTFDQIVVEDIKRQAECAADLGVELFLLDAGWFGTTENWVNEIGNWTENLNGGYYGRVKEVGDYIRSLGMKFGMWLEPERALTNTEAYKSHPEYYKLGTCGSAFLDFANPDARKYITDIAVGLIEKYDLKFMKFDFNAPLAYDDTGDGFYRYFKGVKEFISAVKKNHPDLYLTNCASGGNRMDLYNGMLYDSIWSSDNQSPIYGFRIFKDTALRLPPCHIEKWDVRRFFHGFPEYQNKELVSRPISCNGATWDNVLNVTTRYTHNFMTGGPIGFSTDIADYPEEEKLALKEHIKQFKADRDFYMSANMRILYDAENITVLQYSDTQNKRAIIQIFTNILNQMTVSFYPVLNAESTYIYDGKEITGEELADKGIQFAVGDIDSYTIEIKEIF